MTDPTSNTPEALNEGERVALNRPISVPEGITIRKGEAAYVVDVDPETGALVLQMERYHPALRSCRNLIAADPDDVCRIDPDTQFARMTAPGGDI